MNTFTSYPYINDCSTVASIFDELTLEVFVCVCACVYVQLSISSQERVGEPRGRFLTPLLATRRPGGICQPQSCMATQWTTHSTKMATGTSWPSLTHTPHSGEDMKRNTWRVKAEVMEVEGNSNCNTVEKDGELLQVTKVFKYLHIFYVVQYLYGRYWSPVNDFPIKSVTHGQHMGPCLSFDQR